MSDKSFQELRSRSLFARLKRLFSNDVIVRNIGGKKLKVIDTDEIQYATDRNSLRDRFNRLRTTSYNQYTRDLIYHIKAVVKNYFVIMTVLVLIQSYLYQMVLNQL